ncbi:MAG: HAMP domain-containing histidine kinase [Oscillospiraceae bacterium]|jgi:signal transduction histidine kinase|nr:HAMP domain-containing histidine kinase [Oscillospiraceae bacterium]
MARMHGAHMSFVRKYVFLIMAVVFVGLIIFGVILLLASKEFFTRESLNSLDVIASESAGRTSKNLFSSNKEGVAVYTPNISKLTEIYQLIAVSDRGGSPYTIILTDREGNIVVGVGDITPSVRAVDKAVCANILLEKNAQGYYEQSSLNGLLKERYYVLGVPVYSEGSRKIGCLFACAPEHDLNNFLSYVFNVYIIGMVAVLAFTFTAASISTNRLLSPLADMSAAAKNLAKGDFSKRVPVYNNGYDEMGQLSIAFNNMVSALAAHEESSRNFVANVSHELKTPMTSIGGFIDGILDGTIPESQREQYLKIVSEEVKRLARMVVSMLNISRIEAGEQQLKPTEFDVNAVIIQTLFNFERRIDEKGVDIIGLDTDRQMVCADLDMIHQVVYNLIDNAVKFVNRGGSIEFNYKTEGKFRFIGIKNSGDGISKTEIQQVFDRFYKTDKSRSLDKSGVGLGLNIVKTIIALHGGDIIVNSVLGEYCEFVVSLPIRKEPGTAK